MCGILGYRGPRNGVPLVYEGLKALSYRGYDSWGIAALSDSGITVTKKAGDITKTPLPIFSSTSAIGHTRWATHGGVTDANAHPHLNSERSVAVVHNGIIENYSELKAALIDEGYSFASQTDTEVVPHLIDFYMKKGRTFPDAFVRMLTDLKGSYALVAMHSSEGMMFARNGSPLVLGIGEGEQFVSSDIPSFLSHTKNVVYLDDGDYGSLNDTFKLYRDGKEVALRPSVAHWDVEVAKKGDHPHFMIKEIGEQPLTIRKALNQPRELMQKVISLLKQTTSVYLVGCGTSYNACATATYTFAKAGKQALAVLGSEFSSQLPFVGKDTLLFCVSQSGETADVLDALKSAKKKGATVVSIVNVPSSSIARLSDIVIPMNCGPELCVLSTKSCTSQLAILFSLALGLAGKDSSIIETAADTALHIIKEQMAPMAELAKTISVAKSLFVIGRSSLSPIAREAALKIKEVSYIHAEGMPAGELKHGSIAVIEKGMPVIVFSDDETRELVTSNAMEVKARGAFVVGVDSKNNPAYDVHVSIPELGDATPIVSLLPIQLLSYFVALERGCDPDKPRNLAKSVTVR